MSLTPKSPEELTRNSIGEDLWSHGSISDLIEYPYTSPHYVSNQTPKEKPKLYRYELGGTMVYNSKARIAGEAYKTESHFHKDPANFNRESLKKLLGNIDSKDKKAFIELEKFSPMPEFLPEFTLEIPKNTLRFNSKFESGNLHKAIMLSETLYLLVLEKEPNNNCLQWYYFEVKNPKPVTVTFKIINLGKFESLYNEGMKPLVKSLKNGNEWVRAGFNISYLCNNSDFTYTLEFSYSFLSENDSVFFAYSHPYTYTDLLSDLEKITKNHCEISRVDPICDSLCGNRCYMITITENISTYVKFYEESYFSRISAAHRKLLSKRKQRKGFVSEHDSKKGVFITSRVHSGETVGSFMMQGIIEFLLSPCKEAQTLRKNFVFKLVPMLNPDGVRYGTTRVSMLGVDLNRRWSEPNAILHPTIFHTKKYLKVFTEMHECLLFCDLHGHSTKRNVFLYGCNSKPEDIEQRKKNLMARIVPFMMAKRNKIVSYKDCRFRMQKSKESTARIVVYKELGIVNSLTMEASFYGPKSIDAFKTYRNDLHMNLSDLKNIGKDLVSVCFTLICPSSYIRNLHALSNFIRENNGFKVKKDEIKQEEIKENFKEIEEIKEKGEAEIWNQEIISDIEYSSEESEQSSPSDFEESEESEKPEVFENLLKKIEKKQEPKPLKAPAKELFLKRPLKSIKPEKNELMRSPEAYFKIGGISVFSFNNRTKSSENIFKNSIQKIRPIVSKESLTPDRQKLESSSKTIETKPSKLIILNAESIFNKSDLKSPEKKICSGKIQKNIGPSMEHLYKAWVRSKPPLISRLREIGKISEIPTIKVNKAQIHSILPKC